MRRLLVAALLLLGAPAEAHRLAPSYLALREASDGRFAVTWRTPDVVARGARLAPVLPCDPETAPAALREPGAWVERWRIACPGGLVGRELRVDGLAGSGTDAIVHVTFADGRELRSVLSAARPALRVPARERKHLPEPLQHVARSP